jgi:hypothetical protein
MTDISVAEPEAHQFHEAVDLAGFGSGGSSINPDVHHKDV